MASINTNLPALTAQRNMGLTQSLFHKTVTRLSSGLRINNAADDAAGLELFNPLHNSRRGQIDFFGYIRESSPAVILKNKKYF